MTFAQFKLWHKIATMQTKPLLALFVAFVGLGIFYNATTPIFETPDEVWHYAYVRELAVYHRLPVVDAEGNAPYRHEGLQPPLYYAIGALFIGWMSESDLAMPTPNPFARIGEPRANSNDNRNAFLHPSAEAFPWHGTPLAVHLIRLYSLMLALGTLGLTYALAREIFPATEKSNLSRETAFLAVAFIAFLPQFIFISNAISNDNLATLLTVATLWQIARTMRTGLGYRRVIILGVLVGAALLTKLTTIALTPLVLLALVYASVHSNTQGKAKRVPPRLRFPTSLITNVILFGILVACIAGWWYIRNWMLYGDFTTFGRLAVLVGERARALNFFRWLSAEGEGLRLSTWGVFGWFNIRASPPFYFFFDALAALGLVGMVIALIRRQQLSMRLAILPLWCALILIAFWGYASIIITSQGRLLFPALPALAILWSWGIAALFTRFVKPAIALITTTQCLIALLVPLGVIAPAYTPTIVNAIPTNAQNIHARFDNGIELLASTIDQTNIQPGATLGVTIYQHIPAGKIDSTAMFIHIVNSAGVIVAQRDSLPGNGNLIESSTPLILANNLQIAIPLTVPTQDDWRITAGMYDVRTGERIKTNGVDEIEIAKLYAEPSPADSWNYNFDGRATLAYADFTQTTVNADGVFLLTLHWRNIQPGNNVFVHALGANDKTWGGIDRPLDANVMSIRLPIDPNTPPGIYQLELGVYPAPDGDRVAVFDRNGQESGDRIFLGPVRVR